MEVFGSKIPISWYKIGKSDIKYLNEKFFDEKENILEQAKASTAIIHSSDLFEGYSLLVKNSKRFVPNIMFDNLTLDVYFVSDKEMGSLGRMLRNYQDQYINFLDNTARLNNVFKKYIEEKGLKLVEYNPKQYT